MGNTEDEGCDQVRGYFNHTNENTHCNASPEDGILHGEGDGRGSRLGCKLKCPASLSRFRVEKIEGGLMVAGVVIAANCQLALPAFGFLFVLVGAVLTAASYRGQGKDEDLSSYAARIDSMGNSRVLGPTCIAVGSLMLILGALLCALARRARRRERRIGFHCPVHGDFYPLSPSRAAKLFASKSLNGGGSGGWFACCRHQQQQQNQRQRSATVRGANGLRTGLPQCPHSVISSTRSSLSSSPLSPCPTPTPFLVTSGSMSGMAAGNLSPDQTFGSIRSLSVTREIASFPLSRTPTPPPQHRLISSSTSNNSEEPLTAVSIEPDSPARESEPVVQPAPTSQPRKSVSIVLPNEHHG
ncbi:uncharacterized protein LOC106646030 isoform X2 [Copidosoma floridanum]|uniref:uncharacterized protein LOC106646030 isoform X2 n=1 Tax=Copidosoma floridanum TaxID=29053 RepID=UPI0006C9CC95|nr:uncharacterized protein LOC106646030 isoform X2 [Copidosoma floridanum]